MEAFDEAKLLLVLKARHVHPKGEESGISCHQKKRSSFNRLLEQDRQSNSQGGTPTDPMSLNTINDFWGVNYVKFLDRVNCENKKILRCKGLGLNQKTRLYLGGQGDLVIMEKKMETII